MSEHKAIIEWKCGDGEFLKGRYSREHRWRFDGGAEIPASPTPSVVPAPWSNAAYVDPEEAYVASIASCHMLWFLHVAGSAGFDVESYTDEAGGVLNKNEQGAFWISKVTLNPSIVFGEIKEPSTEELERLHHQAHQNCFIANSVKTEVAVEFRDK